MKGMKKFVDCHLKELNIERKLKDNWRAEWSFTFEIFFAESSEFSTHI